MKKSLFVVAIVLVSIPLFANASWWNPIDWFSFIGGMFHPQVIEKIVYLPATTTPVTVTDTQTNTPVTSTTVDAKTNTVPVVNIPSNKTVSATKPVQAVIPTPKQQPVVQTTIPVQPQQTPTTNTASATISSDPANPSTQSVSAQNGSYSNLPVLVFDIQPSSQGQSLNSLTVDFNSSGQGSVTTARLYSGNAANLNGTGVSLVSTAAIINGSATFTNLQNNSSVVQSLSSLRFPSGSYNIFTIEVDISGQKDSDNLGSISASISTAKIVDLNNQNVAVTGTVQGNKITVSNYRVTPLNSTVNMQQ